MLYFHAARPSELPGLRYDGIRGGARLYPSLEAAQRAASEEAECLLALDAAWLHGVETETAASETVFAEAVPPAAFCNLDPYRALATVEAGGGYVVRAGASATEVLLIYRRGAWDLPKGKRDPGETIEDCALREVHEEVGARLGPEGLRLIRVLKPTVHGYAHKGQYAVKTTHWFLMRTSQETFTPETREGIEEVAWVPWSEAQERLGYASLRRHMQEIGDAGPL